MNKDESVSPTNENNMNMKLASSYIYIYIISEYDEISETLRRGLVMSDPLPQEVLSPIPETIIYVASSFGFEVCL